MVILPFVSVELRVRSSCLPSFVVDSVELERKKCCLETSSSKVFLTYRNKVVDEEVVGLVQAQLICFDRAHIFHF